MLGEKVCEKHSKCIESVQLSPLAATTAIPTSDSQSVTIACVRSSTVRPAASNSNIGEEIQGGDANFEIISNGPLSIGGEDFGTFMNVNLQLRMSMNECQIS